MAMTKQHYEKWASTLGAQKATFSMANNKYRLELFLTDVDNLMSFTIDTVCELLKEDNPDFNEDLFKDKIEQHYENALFADND